MIVSAHILPHTPLLMPTIGKDRTSAFKLTVPALEAAVQQIKEAKPDTIVIVSGHGTIYKDAFSVNIHDPYRAHFEEFGDFGTTFKARPDLETVDRLKRHLRTAGVSFTQDSDGGLDYGSCVTLSFLAPIFQKTRLIPLSPSQLDAKSHFEAGLHTSEVLLASNRRFSLICSGDLSQRLTTSSPGGYSKSGETFDAKIRELVISHNILGLLKLDPELVAEAGECLYRPLLMTLGIIEAFPYRAEELSYEAPFGVGELAIKFSF